MEMKETALPNFKPLTEEEQKDLLFIIADGIDFYIEQMSKVKNKSDKKRLWELYETYSFFCRFLIDDPEWLKEVGLSGAKFALRMAHKDRIAYEAKRKEKQA